MGGHGGIPEKTGTPMMYVSSCEIPRLPAGGYWVTSSSLVSGEPTVTTCAKGPPQHCFTKCTPTSNFVPNSTNFTNFVPVNVCALGISGFGDCHLTCSNLEMNKTTY